MDLPQGFHQEVIEAREKARKKVPTSLLNRGEPSFDTHSLHKTKNNNLCFKLSPRLGFETIILFMKKFLRYFFVIIGVLVISVSIFNYFTLANNNQREWCIQKFEILYNQGDADEI
ncbi:hypothetical protein, partial [Winogradskyella sp.]|uniref:hypothetical protein n=1 Tax=Winogradskyella sp. TaxID=1883156 RepID=UPI003510D55E